MMTVITVGFQLVILSTMKIVNMIVVSDLKININLEKLSNVRYDSKKFSGAIFKTPLSTVLIFKNGKIVMTGVKQIPDIDNIITIVRDHVKDINKKANPPYKIKNVVAVSSLPAIKLSSVYKIFRKHFKTIFYEPEIFPAIHIKEKNSCLALYASGKLISTGIIEKSEIIKKHQYIQALINLYF